MKSNLIKMTALLIAIAGLSLTSCKKDNQTINRGDNSSLQQLSKDENQMQSADDEAMNDVNGVLSGNGLKSTEWLPCNVDDSTVIANDTLYHYLTYHGLNCTGTKYRTGQVIIKKHVATNWGSPLATVIVTFNNLHITKVLTQKSITLNGQKTHQNVTGGHIWQLGNGISSVVFKTWGYMQVTFDDNTTRTWNIARQLTYTGTPGHLILTIDGFGSEAGMNNLVVWGINRNGEIFYAQIQVSIVHKQTCDWDPCSGIKIFSIPSAQKQATATYGFNSNNQPIGPNECPTKYKLDWQVGTNSGTLFLWL